MMRWSSHTGAVLTALLVTFLWSTSWILIKQGLHELPPLLFAGLRYGIAALVLVPWLWARRKEVRAISSRQWLNVALLGIFFYALTQGGQFLTLNYLDAIPFSLMLNGSSILVALAGIFVLREIPTRFQWIGILVFLGGALLYFSPLSSLQGSAIGFVFAALTVCANAVASLLGRSINRESAASPLVVTALSMGIGAALLLAVGGAIEGVPALSAKSWGIIMWLAIVNTALAFTLWNRSLCVLTAVESSTINSTMLAQIAFLALIFLGETISLSELIGLAIAVTGVMIVQWKRRRTPS